jgi:hypothetical protein
MSKYGFVIEATISMGIDVEADSLEAAIEKAKGAGVMSLCHQCARGEEGVWNTSGELDCGDPGAAVLAAVYCDGEEVDLDVARKGW